MKSFIALVLTLTVLLISCEREANLLPLPIEPTISIASVSTDTIVQFQENLIIELKYEDGDGDLGNEDTDINSLFIKDARLPEPDAYYVAPLAPKGDNISISGKLKVTLSSPFILGNGEQETTYFEMWMVDRKGHKSNVVITNPILIKKM